ncbi:MAG: hypothetical protein OXU61_08000, partial [Gammaproteobacteria bacterium]|nr:hypothetical protein [Gammaproteobacteria bacterium]
MAATLLLSLCWAGQARAGEYAVFSAGGVRGFIVALDALGTSGQVAPASSDTPAQRNLFMQAARGGLLSEEHVSYYLAARAAGTITVVHDNLLFLRCQCSEPSLDRSTNPNILLAPLITIAAPSLADLGETGVTLTASVGGEGAAMIASQAWTQISGASVTIANSDMLAASFTAPGTAGDLVFQVEITERPFPLDSRRVTGTRRVTVTAAAATFALSGPGNAEEGAAAQYVVTYTGGSALPAGGATLDYAVTGGAGMAAAADFAGGNFPSGDNAIVFPGGAASGATQTFSVTPLDDDISEAAERFSVTIGDLQTSAPGAVIFSAEASVDTVIGESDRLVTLSIAAPGSALTEGASATFTVSFPELVNTAAAVAATWTITPGTAMEMATATSDADFSVRTGTVTIPAGMRSMTVPITAADDDLNEGIEIFLVTLSAPTGGSPLFRPVLATAPSAQATIAASDDAMIGISNTSGTDTDPAVAGFQVPEGSAGRFTIVLSDPADRMIAVRAGAPIEVNYMIDGTVADAASAADYIAAGSVIIEAGQSSAEISIALVADAVTPEMDERIRVRLATIDADAGAGMLAFDLIQFGPFAGMPDFGDVFIRDVVFPRHFSVRAIPAGTTSIAEGGTFHFQLTLAGDQPLPGERSTVDWVIGGDVTMDDYEITGGSDTDGTISVAPIGDSLGPDDTACCSINILTLRITDDMVSEDAEDLTITLSNPAGGGGAGAGIATASDTVTIRESDRPVTLGIAGPGSALTEGTAANFAVSFAEATVLTDTLGVRWTITHGASPESATTDADFSVLTGLVFINAGQSSTNIPITAREDNMGEQVENFLVTLSEPYGGGPHVLLALAEPPSVEASIAANAGPPRNFSVTADSAMVSEGGTATFTVELTGTAPETGNVSTVTWTLSGVETTDYTAPASAGGALTFGSLGSETVSVAVAADGLNEAAETLTFTLSDSGGGGVGGTGVETAVAQTTIAASDPVTYSIADAGSVAEGAPGATATLTFAVSLSGASEGAVTIPYRLGGTATDGTDYDALPPNAVTVLAGETTANLVIAVQGDDLNEADERIEVTLLAETDGAFAKEAAAGTVTLTTTMDDRSGSGTITDDDTVVYSIADAGTVTEGASGTTTTLTFTVSLSGASAGAVTVPYTLGGTATGGGTDYVTPPGTLTIVAGETTANLVIMVLGDDSNEPDERIEVTLLAETVAAFAKEAAAGTVT